MSRSNVRPKIPKSGKTPKYFNKKVVYKGESFDSIKEMNRYAELELMEKAGTISDLRRQVKFNLLPAQYKDGKCVERSLDYIADFAYMIHDYPHDRLIVEDVKGYRNPQSPAYAKYVIKRKLMLYRHGIQIVEI